MYMSVFIAEKIVLLNRENNKLMKLFGESIKKSDDKLLFSEKHTCFDSIKHIFLSARNGGNCRHSLH